MAKIRMLRPLVAVAALCAMLIGVGANVAEAACYCTCMNGTNQPICDTAIEVRPICAPRICPIEPPSIRPIQPPTVPPLGTRNCRQEQVWDHNYQRYVWKTICR
jgi:hypothetical protein